MPVITVGSPSNAATELIHDGRNGWVVPADVDALAGAVRHAVSTPAPAGLAAHVDEYSWERVANRYALRALYQVGVAPTPDDASDRPVAIRAGR